MVSINSNSAALFAQRNLNLSSTESQNSIARLSSGQSIIAAKDDVAGLSVGTILSTAISTLKTAQTSTSQAQSMLAIADGGLKNIGDILQRQKALAVQANTGSLSDNERGFLNQEFQNLTSEIDRIVTNTNLNGVNLIDGTLSNNSNLQVSAPGNAGAGFTDVGAVGDRVLDGDTFTIGDTADSTLIGSMSNASVDVTFTVGNTVNIDLNFNGKTYSKDGINTNPGAGAAFDVELTNAETGSKITIKLKETDIGNQGAANILATNIESDISTIEVYQTRETGATEADGGLNAEKFQNTILNGMSNSDFTFTSNDFDTTNNKAPTVDGFKVTAETASTDGKIQVTINGSVFETEAGAFDLNKDDLKAKGEVTLTNQSDNNEKLTIDFDNLEGDNQVRIDTSDNASALEDALNTLFGAGSQGGADFQVGTVSTDKISVSINSSATSTIYRDNEGAVNTLDISTVDGAVKASEVLDNAINTITSFRADVGALQSRFEFASSNLASSIQNRSAARSDFLDVDVAAESTNFAASQVRLQASVSVLAQANQLPQNLLKLIG